MAGKIEVELPESWVKTDIGHVYDVIGGGTPSTSKSAYWNGSIPWITSADILGVRKIEVSRYVTTQGVENSTTNVVPERTLLVVTRVGLGKIAIAPEPICFSQDLQGLVQNADLLHPEYTLYFLSFELQRLKFEGRGTTISGLTKKQLKDTTFPLPPFNEQRRIVEKIEELFSELDKGVESLKTAKQQLKVYRQALLKHAFEGKLTAQWREENNIPEKWHTQSLGECGLWQGGGTPSKSVPSYWENGNILWVTPKDMKHRIIQNSLQKITELGVNNSSAKITNDFALLFVVRSGILRRVLPIGISIPSITVNQDMQAMIPHKDNIYYLFWFCLANERTIREKCAKDGTTVESVEVAKLKRFPVALPSLEEQNEIVQRIETHMSLLEQIGITIDNELQKASLLYQAILKKAFSGQLVPQEPNDEPASVLLERINTEKASQSKPQKSRKPKSKSIKEKELEYEYV